MRSFLWTHNFTQINIKSVLCSRKIRSIIKIYFFPQPLPTWKKKECRKTVYEKTFQTFEQKCARREEGETIKEINFACLGVHCETDIKFGYRKSYCSNRKGSKKRGEMFSIMYDIWYTCLMKMFTFLFEKLSISTSGLLTSTTWVSYGGSENAIRTSSGKSVERLNFENWKLMERIVVKAYAVGLPVTLPSALSEAKC